MKLSTRIALAYVLIVTLLVTVCGYSARRTSALADVADRIASERIARLEKLQLLRNNFNAQGHQLRNVLISQDRAFQQAELKKSDAIKTTNKNVLSEILRAETDETARQRLQEVAGFIDAFNAEIDNTSRLALQGSLDEARKNLIGPMRDRQMPLFKAVDESVKRQVELSEALALQARKDAHLTAWLTMALGGLGTVLAVGACWWIVRSVRLSLGGEPADLGGAARRVAGGDLTPIPLPSGTHPDSVFASIAAMQQSLHGIVMKVRDVADSISTGATQIAAGSSNLSQQTEGQAGALQETSATMDALTETVRSNADHTRTASQLAQEAAEVALKGRDAVSRVVEAMSGIDGSSSRIGDIIGVIDGIAFQTNILALNAAVEAARAGEDGRGFAVVAAEVRSLAQRSAAAAREIRDLIQSSQGQVRNGSSIASESGDAMREIEAAVSRMAVVVTEISAATSDQSDGIAQVGTTIGQLEDSTQRNAALAEESAAAARSLEQQAVALMEAVSLFRLHAGTST
ncbi:methyl-accepting chemotaxis protein [Paracidovorax citrulli]|uniref:Methyl-accepting chemotaxis sensory transducer n=2 Tax=Paracidovorax citrulli TaxID=80869 RepID=A1TP01_PARC0|nr:methyl-accepting chemotaxis protein [Paracidovorax citrulli]ABM32689.1 methyl-accepting chemotaxis sensory transducer [Paracidovorax citrulli AAC00-1]ATG93311.1 chemotaxis protein [Paracidovorax citrulli]MVT28654.1 chemotaxis protein [Paracidovorax citrulli]PVY66906.1 methyl-accepting chemotaxis protein [Paracidovorax citrulli]REG68931.1 methyl-accepting chemotaxis protein [Paracidovorax citrulli]